MQAHQDEFMAEPLQDDLFEWHFVVPGPPDTEFEVRGAHTPHRVGRRFPAAPLPCAAHAHLPLPPPQRTQGGVYHGRILLPPEYPFKPPAFM